MTPQKEEMPQQPAIRGNLCFMDLCLLLVPAAVDFRMFTTLTVMLAGNRILARDQLHFRIAQERTFSF
jgi:hypothetical protein